MQNNAERLRSMLEVAAQQGVLIYQGEKLATPDDIAKVQSVHESSNYMPEFIVKNSLGEIKEIWYGEAMKPALG